MALVIVVFAQYLLWYFAGRGTADDAATTWAVDNMLKNWRSLNVTPDHFFLCIDSVDSSSPESIERIAGKLEQMEIETHFGSDFLVLRRESAEADTTITSLCTQPKVNTPLFAVVEVRDGYGKMPGFGYSQDEVFLFVFGTWLHIGGLERRRLIY